MEKKSDYAIAVRQRARATGGDQNTKYKDLRNGAQSIAKHRTQIYDIAIIYEGADAEQRPTEDLRNRAQTKTRNTT